VHHHVDVGMVGDDPFDDPAVGDVTHVEVASLAELLAAGGQVVENNRLDPRFKARRRDSGTDVSGAAGDQSLHRAPS
jgi:hypothetical protein